MFPFYLTIYILYISIIFLKSIKVVISFTNENNINNLNCPVSSLLRNSTIDGIYSYAMEVFDHLQYQTVSQDDLYNCIVDEGNKIGHFMETKKYHCSTKTNCPITNDNIIDSLHFMSSTYTYKHSLCHLRNELQNPHSNINIVIIGGSVTLGIRNNKGCCCNNQQLESKCLSGESNRCLEDECSWNRRFFSWIKSLSKGQVNFVKLAETGRNTPVFAKDFFSIMQENNIPKFKSHDLIIIDESVNDAWITNFKVLETGIDMLIRSIFHYSENNELPTIILPEGWPYPMSTKQSCEDLRSRRGSNSICESYTSVYRKYAEKYQIILYSFHDLAINHTVDAIKPYLMFQKTYDNHPGWLFHLYYADVLASLILREFNACANDLNAIHQRKVKDKDMVVEKYLPYNHTSYYLSFCFRNQCIESILFDSSNIRNVIGSLTKIPTSSWEYRSDKFIGPLEWIDEVIPNPSNITLVSENYISILTFHNTFVESTENNNEFLLTIKYFKTYENGGIVDVFICDTYLVTLDALWDNGNKYSSEETYEKLLNIKSFTCLQNKPSIVFKHRYVTSNDGKIRGNQKFKIYLLRLRSGEIHTIEV